MGILDDLLYEPKSNYGLPESEIQKIMQQDAINTTPQYAPIPSLANSQIVQQDAVNIASPGITFNPVPQAPAQDWTIDRTQDPSLLPQAPAQPDPFAQPYIQEDAINYGENAPPVFPTNWLATKTQDPSLSLPIPPSKPNPHQYVEDYRQPEQIPAPVPIDNRNTWLDYGDGSGGTWVSPEGLMWDSASKSWVRGENPDKTDATPRLSQYNKEKLEYASKYADLERATARFNENQRGFGTELNPSEFADLEFKNDLQQQANRENYLNNIYKPMNISGSGRGRLQSQPEGGIGPVQPRENYWIEQPRVIDMPGNQNLEENILQSIRQIPSQIDVNLASKNGPLVLRRGTPYDDKKVNIFGKDVSLGSLIYYAKGNPVLNEIPDPSDPTGNKRIWVDPSQEAIDKFLVNNIVDPGWRYIAKPATAGFISMANLLGGGLYLADGGQKSPEDINLAINMIRTSSSNLQNQFSAIKNGDWNRLEESGETPEVKAILKAIKDDVFNPLNMLYVASMEYMATIPDAFQVIFYDLTGQKEKGDKIMERHKKIWYEYGYETLNPEPSNPWLSDFQKLTPYKTRGFTDTIHQLNKNWEERSDTQKFIYSIIFDPTNLFMGAGLGIKFLKYADKAGELNIAMKGIKALALLDAAFEHISGKVLAPVIGATAGYYWSQLNDYDTRNTVIATVASAGVLAGLPKAIAKTWATAAMIRAADRELLAAERSDYAKAGVRNISEFATKALEGFNKNGEEDETWKAFINFGMRRAERAPENVEGRLGLKTAAQSEGAALATAIQGLINRSSENPEIGQSAIEAMRKIYETGAVVDANANVTVYVELPAADAAALRRNATVSNPESMLFTIEKPTRVASGNEIVRLKFKAEEMVPVFDADGKLLGLRTAKPEVRATRMLPYADTPGTAAARSREAMMAELRAAAEKPELGLTKDAVERVIEVLNYLPNEVFDRLALEIGGQAIIDPRTGEMVAGQFIPDDALIRIADGIAKMGEDPVKVILHEIAHSLEQIINKKDYERLWVEYMDWLKKSGDKTVRQKLFSLKEQADLIKKEVEQGLRTVDQLSDTEKELFKWNPDNPNSPQPNISDTATSFHEWFAEVMSEKMMRDAMSDDSRSIIDAIREKISGIVRGVSDFLKSKNRSDYAETVWKKLTSGDYEVFQPKSENLRYQPIMNMALTSSSATREAQDAAKEYIESWRTPMGASYRDYATQGAMNPLSAAAADYYYSNDYPTFSGAADAMNSWIRDSENLAKARKAAAKKRKTDGVGEKLVIKPSEKYDFKIAKNDFWNRFSGKRLTDKDMAAIEKEMERRGVTASSSTPDPIDVSDFPFATGIDQQTDMARIGFEAFPWYIDIAEAANRELAGNAKLFQVFNVMMAHTTNQTDPITNVAHAFELMRWFMNEVKFGRLPHPTVDEYKALSKSEKKLLLDKWENAAKGFSLKGPKGNEMDANPFKPGYYGLNKIQKPAGGGSIRTAIENYMSGKYIASSGKAPSFNTNLFGGLLNFFGFTATIDRHELRLNGTIKISDNLLKSYIRIIGGEEGKFNRNEIRKKLLDDAAKELLKNKDRVVTMVSIDPDTNAIKVNNPGEINPNNILKGLSKYGKVDLDDVTVFTPSQQKVLDTLSGDAKINKMYEFTVANTGTPALTTVYSAYRDTDGHKGLPYLIQAGMDIGIGKKLGLHGSAIQAAKWIIGDFLSNKTGRQDLYLSWYLGQKSIREVITDAAHSKILKDYVEREIDSLSITDTQKKASKVFWNRAIDSNILDRERLYEEADKLGIDVVINEIGPLPEKITDPVRAMQVVYGLKSGQEVDVSKFNVSAFRGDPSDPATVEAAKRNIALAREVVALNKELEDSGTDVWARWGLAENPDDRIMRYEGRVGGSKDSPEQGFWGQPTVGTQIEQRARGLMEANAPIISVSMTPGGEEGRAKGWKMSQSLDVVLRVLNDKNVVEDYEGKKIFKALKAIDIPHEVEVEYKPASWSFDGGGGEYSIFVRIGGDNPMLVQTAAAILGKTLDQDAVSIFYPSTMKNIDELVRKFPNVYQRKTGAFLDIPRLSDADELKAAEIIRQFAPDFDLSPFPGTNGRGYIIPNYWGVPDNEFAVMVQQAVSAAGFNPNDLYQWHAVNTLVERKSYDGIIHQDPFAIQEEVLNAARPARPAIPSFRSKFAKQAPDLSFSSEGIASRPSLLQERMDDLSIAARKHVEDVAGKSGADNQTYSRHFAQRAKEWEGIQLAPEDNAGIVKFPQMPEQIGNLTPAEAEATEKVFAPLRKAGKSWEEAAAEAKRRLPEFDVKKMSAIAAGGAGGMAVPGQEEDNKEERSIGSLVGMGVVAGSLSGKDKKVFKENIEKLAKKGILKAGKIAASLDDDIAESISDAADENFGELIDFMSGEPRTPKTRRSHIEEATVLGREPEETVVSSAIGSEFPNLDGSTSSMDWGIVGAPAVGFDYVEPIRNVAKVATKFIGPIVGAYALGGQPEDEENKQDMQDRISKGVVGALIGGTLQHAITSKQATNLITRQMERVIADTEGPVKLELFRSSKNWFQNAEEKGWSYFRKGVDASLYGVNKVFPGIEPLQWLSKPEVNDPMRNAMRLIGIQSSSAAANSAAWTARLLDVFGEFKAGKDGIKRGLDNLGRVHGLPYLDEFGRVLNTDGELFDEVGGEILMMTDVQQIAAALPVYAGLISPREAYENWAMSHKGKPEYLKAKYLTDELLGAYSNVRVNYLGKYASEHYLSKDSGEIWKGINDVGKWISVWSALSEKKTTAKGVMLGGVYMPRRVARPSGENAVFMPNTGVNVVRQTTPSERARAFATMKAGQAAGYEYEALSDNFYNYVMDEAKAHIIRDFTNWLKGSGLGIQIESKDPKMLQIKKEIEEIESKIAPRKGSISKQQRGLKIRENLALARISEMESQVAVSETRLKSLASLLAKAETGNQAAVDEAVSALRQIRGDLNDAYRAVIDAATTKTSLTEKERNTLRDARRASEQLRQEETRLTSSARKNVKKNLKNYGPQQSLESQAAQDFDIDSMEDTDFVSAIITKGTKPSKEDIDSERARILIDNVKIRDRMVSLAKQKAGFIEKASSLHDDLIQAREDLKVADRTFRSNRDKMTAAAKRVAKEKAGRRVAELEAQIKEEERVLRRLKGTATKEGRIARAQDRVADYRVQWQRKQSEINVLKLKLDALMSDKEKRKLVIKEGLKTKNTLINIDDLKDDGWLFDRRTANYINSRFVKKGKPGREMQIFDAVNDTLRTLTANGDLSQAGIGLSTLSYTKPDIVARAFKDSLLGATDPNNLGRYILKADQEAIQNFEPTVQEMTSVGMHISAAAEIGLGSKGSSTASEVIESIPGLGTHYLAPATRQFANMANFARIELFKTMYRDSVMRIGEERARSIGNMREIARAVNTATGYAESGPFAKGPISRFLFAGRFFQSLVDQVVKTIDVTSWRYENSVARQQLIRMMGMASLMTVAMNNALGNETDFRPWIERQDGSKYYNPNFMTVRVGSHDISLFGPWVSMFRLVITAAQGDFIDAFSSKLGPVPSVAVDVTRGRTFTGEDPLSGSAIAQRLLPFFGTAAYKEIVMTANGEQNAVDAAFGIFAQLFGLRISPMTEYEKSDRDFFKKYGKHLNDPDVAGTNLVKEWEEQGNEIDPTTRRGKIIKESNDKRKQNELEIFNKYVEKDADGNYKTDKAGNVVFTGTNVSKFKSEISQLEHDSALLLENELKRDANGNEIKDYETKRPDNPLQAALWDYWNSWKKSSFEYGGQTHIDFEMQERLLREAQKNWTKEQFDFVENRRTQSHSKEVQSYFDAKRKLTNSGFWNIYDDAWAATINRGPSLAEYKSFDDWFSSQESFLLEYYMKQGNDQDIARKLAITKIKNGEVYNYFTRAKDAFHQAWMDKHASDGIAAMASYWGWLTSVEDLLSISRSQ